MAISLSIKWRLLSIYSSIPKSQRVLLGPSGYRLLSERHCFGVFGLQGLGRLRCSYLVFVCWGGGDVCGFRGLGFLAKGGSRDFNCTTGA